MALFGFGKSKVAETTIKVGYNGKEAQKGLSGLKKTIKAVVSAYALKQVASFTIELAKVGAMADVVSRSFEKFANDSGKNAEKMMYSLRKATKGMVTDMRLQQQAMQALIAGVDFDSVVTAMEYVTNFAITTGTDVNVKMQSVMTGLARKSAAFLDDVGIQVMGSKDVIGDAIDQMKEKMGQFIVSEDDAIVKTRQLEAEFKNLRIELGRELTPALLTVVNLLRDTAEGWKFLATGKGFAKISKNAEKLVELGEERTKVEKRIAFMEKQGVRTADVLLYTHSKTNEEIIEMNKHLTVMNLIGNARRAATHIQSRTDLNLNALYVERKKILEQINKITGTTKSRSKKSKTQEKNLAVEEAVKAGDELDEIHAKKEATEMLNALSHSEALQDIANEHQQELLNIQTIADMAHLSQEELDHKNQIAFINSKYAEYEQLYSDNEDVLKNIKIAKDKELEALQDQHNETMLTKEKEQQQKRLLMQKQTIISLSNIVGSFQSYQSILLNKRLDDLDQENMSERKRARERTKLIEKSKEEQKKMARFEQGLAVAQAIVDTHKAATGVLSDTPGGVIVKTIAAAAAVAQGMLQVASIQAQHFELGGTVGGKTQRYRSRDTVPAMLGTGERVISAPQAATHEATLDAIANNTLNTSMSIKRLGGGGGVTNNFYSITDEQLARLVAENKRRNYVGERI